MPLGEAMLPTHRIWVGLTVKIKTIHLITDYILSVTYSSSQRLAQHFLNTRTCIDWGAENMSLHMSHPDFWTRALQFTPDIHRDVYPALEPKSQRLQGIAKGKVVLVTGAGSGFGKVSHSWFVGL